MAQTLNLGSNRFTNLNNLFYAPVDEDNAFLSHREQLIMALSIIRTKKEKTADWLFSRHRSILDPQNKESIEKISACIVLSEILESMMARIELYLADKTNPRKLNVRLMMNNSLGDQPVYIPSFAIANSLRNFERAFNVSIASCHVSFLNDPHKQVAVVDINATTAIRSGNTSRSINNAPIRLSDKSFSEG